MDIINAMSLCVHVYLHMWQICMHTPMCVYTKSLCYIYLQYLFFKQFVVVLVLGGGFFCLNPLSAFSIPAGYDTHSFVFRSPRTRTERCVQSTKRISRKKDKKKSNITKANCLHHLSPRPPPRVLGNQSEKCTTMHKFIIHKCHKAMSGISVFRIFPLELCIHIPMHTVRMSVDTMITIIASPDLDALCLRSYRGQAVLAELSFSMWSALLQDFRVLIRLHQMKRWLLSGWFSMLRGTVREGVSLCWYRRKLFHICCHINDCRWGQSEKAR